MNIRSMYPLALVVALTLSSPSTFAAGGVRYALSDVAERALPSVVTVLSTRNMFSGEGNSGWSHPFFGWSHPEQPVI